MPILLFLIDTSASMNQRTYLGTTYLDIAKGAVEIFMKLRARDPASRGDRYMLVTFDEPPYCIKAGWKENHATFMNELKNLQATGLTTLGQALRSSFDLLNLNRLVSGIDNYGQGRNPFFLEPSILITITDGSKLTNNACVQEELHLPLNSPLPGSELTKEPFRWDQRLFALVLRLPGASFVEPEQLGSVSSDESAITQMCEVTGGRSYCVRTQRMLNQCLESLVQKVQSGVVINFEKTGPDPTPTGEDSNVDQLKPTTSCTLQPWHSCHKLIYVRPNPKTGVPVGHWPVPESFWPDQNSPTLPPRTAHPVVRFSCADCEPMVIDKLPFDKYELEPSPLTQYILERKSPHSCWQVFVNSSGKYSDLGHPFGYLKASTTLTCVNLFVMPYNYPVLLPLLDDLFKVHKLKPNLKWRQAFENYLKTMPPYFLLSLKKALRMMGAPNLISDNLDCGLSYSVISYLKKLSQQAKIESDRIIGSVGKKAPQEAGIKVKNHSSGLSLAHRKDFKLLLQGITGEAPLRLAEINVKEFAGFQIAFLNKDLKPQTYKNAYDIPRQNLLDQLTRMRTNLLKTTQKHIRGQDDDYVHSIPVAQMGNYQEYLKMMPSPLREIDPDQPKRLHTFGNPFKQDKKGMMIDEADEFVTGPQNKTKRPGDVNSPASIKRRRSMSPLLRRSQTPPIISNHVGGKGPPPTSTSQSNPNLIKPVLVHKDANNILEPEGNGDKKAENCQSLEKQLDSLSSQGPTSKPNVFVNEELLASGLEMPPEEANCINEDGLDHKPVARSLGKGPFENCTEAVGDGGMSTETTSRTTVPNSIKVVSRIEGTNAEIKIRLMKEVRKPGRNYERIFTLLEEVQGPIEIQRKFIDFTIKEAARFKKRVLIQQLEQVLQTMESNSLHHTVNHINSR
ncbi:integrator complex subunit 6 isoform X1 [Latimeria chalumnae]|uniref:integrator complex subunit 6 isoform X1 n=1 Tax=Latimeria chalumnae TaxID=7897 RepID=UPI0003C156EA|nr:PREDICTED: integrator complex subunit 6 isoform X1 [Latimeria chalumnae]|eukprot:XP_005990420.1 PREDICTED: integrator complex subunit 6 isoform X1 [Latimeria chalumnae]